MILKNYSKKRKITKIDFKRFLNYRYLFYFLVSFFIIAFVLGIIFYFCLNNSDQNIIKDNIVSYFTISDKYNYLSLFFKSLLNHFGNIFLFWLLGISVLGLPLLLFYGFIESFSLGLLIAGIIKLYGLKSILGIFCYLFPAFIFFFILEFFLIYFGLKFGIELILHLFKKKDGFSIKVYLKKLSFGLIISFILCIFEVFLTPFFIKLFTII